MSEVLPLRGPGPMVPGSGSVPVHSRVDGTAISGKKGFHEPEELDEFDEPEEFPGFISKAWAELATDPVQEHPGSLTGKTHVTYDAYRQMMEHCGIQAAFLVDHLRFTPTGRVGKHVVPRVSELGDLTMRTWRQTWSPSLQEYWTGLRRAKISEESWRKHCCSIQTFGAVYGFDEDAQSVESLDESVKSCDESLESEDWAFAKPFRVPGVPHATSRAPTFMMFRLRDAPFRLDPEWQFDDDDVAVAWQTVDIATLRGLGVGFVTEATVLVSSLGRWPRSSAHAYNRSMRAETRLANAVNAWASLRAAEFTSSPGVITFLHLSGEAAGLASETWCTRTESMLRRFGLHVQGVPGEMVFCHAPSKRRGIEQQKKLLQDAGIYQ